MNKRNTTHNQSGNHLGKQPTRTYKSWNGMLNRCRNVNDLPHKRMYIDKSIKVCERWRKFENFFKDMGERPKGKTLDRINGKGNYEPSNCRWATIKEQADNRGNLITYNGNTMNVTQWSNFLGISRVALSSRIHHLNWDIEKAFTTPLLTKFSSLYQK